MKADEELKELRAREARARQAVLKVAAEVTPILADDLLQYPLREVRRRFVASPEFAAAMDDDRIAALKADLAARASQARDRVARALEDPEPWVEAGEPQGPGKSFAENARLWAPTEEVVSLVREVLETYKFPEAGGDPEYRMPTWFIGGKFLPGLAEKYWALVGELRDLRARIADVEQAQVRDSLGRRWDKV